MERSSEPLNRLAPSSVHPAFPPDSGLAATIAAIEPLDSKAMDQARSRQSRLTKPQGSLGRLETLSIQLAGIQRTALPRTDRKVIFVFAGDHGVTAEGVSAYPSEVTPQMVLNFLRGGAAINVLARTTGAPVIVADLGVAADLPDRSDLISRKVGPGTRNFTREPAMTLSQARQALEAGTEILDRAGPTDLVAIGEMGIGNTTASSALTAALTGSDPLDVTGRGTGVDDEGYRRKVDVITRALELHSHGPDRPFETLASLGGFEIAGMSGLILGAAAKRVAVLIDGFISGTAALVAATIAPSCTPYLIAGHRSVEAGHRIILERLGLEPLLDLQLRLGEGSGAALAMPIVDAACRLLREMATFEDAGVSERSADPPRELSVESDQAQEVKRTPDLSQEPARG